MAPVKTSTGNNPYLERAYALDGKDSTQARAVYDEWALKYDEDVLGSTQGYVAPGIAAATAAKHLDKPIGSVTILDAGCGTGQVGVKLAALGAKHISGLDVSPGMLGVAQKTGAYEHLDTADLTKQINVKDGTYDVITCVGTLTHGHVGPEAFAEFVRITKKGGIIVATVIDDIWEEKGFKTEVERLGDAGAVQIIGTQIEDYRKSVNVTARMVTLRVL